MKPLNRFLLALIPAPILCSAGAWEQTDESVIQGWTHLSPIGWVHVEPESDWAYSLQMQWIFSIATDREDRWIFADCNWLRITKNSPFIWSLISRDWITLYNQDSSTWVYDYRLQEWTNFGDHYDRNAYQNGWEAGVHEANTRDLHSWIYEDSDAPYETGYMDGFNAELEKAREEGYAAGWKSGYSQGSSDGWSDAYATAYQEGYAEGYGDAYYYGSDVGSVAVISDRPPIMDWPSPVEEAWDEAFFYGSADGYDPGYSDGYQEGEATGYEDGYAAGYAEGQSASSGRLTRPPRFP